MRSRRANVAPRVVGPGFHAQVYELVRQIPAGKVATYGQLAALLGAPSVARHVGFAMAAIPHGAMPVPWHRVINARGGISEGVDIDRGQRQRAALEDEGVEFRPNGRVDLRRYGWAGPA